MLRRGFLRKLGFGLISAGSAALPKVVEAAIDPGPEKETSERFSVHAWPPQDGPEMEKREYESKAVLSFEQPIGVEASHPWDSEKGGIIHLHNRPTTDALCKALWHNCVSHPHFGAVHLKKGWKFSDQSFTYLTHVPVSEYDWDGKLLRRWTIVDLVGPDVKFVPIRVYSELSSAGFMDWRKVNPSIRTYHVPVWTCINGVKAKHVVVEDLLAGKKKTYPSDWASSLHVVFRPDVDPCPRTREEINFPLLRRLQRHGWNVDAFKVEIDRWEDEDGHHEVTRYKDLME